jgi:ribosome biogenesis ATPase
MCAKLRLGGDFDFAELARSTPGYVGADLAALTGAAGIIAVKRIFQQLSDGSLVLPDDPTAVDGDAVMSVDPPSAGAINDSISKPTGPFSSLVLPSFSTASSIATFLSAHPSPLTDIQLEPLYLTREDFAAARAHVQPSAKREGFATIPDVSWADVGALHATRDALHMAIVQPIRRPRLFARVGVVSPAGVLLWGPPGCGKTLLAKAVANESKANFISVKGPELLNKVRPSFS